MFNQYFHIWFRTSFLYFTNLSKFHARQRVLLRPQFLPRPVQFPANYRRGGRALEGDRRQRGACVPLAHVRPHYADIDYQCFLTFTHRTPPFLRYPFSQRCSRTHAHTYGAKIIPPPSPLPSTPRVRQIVIVEQRCHRAINVLVY